MQPRGGHLLDSRIGCLAQCEGGAPKMCMHRVPVMGYLIWRVLITVMIRKQYVVHTWTRERVLSLFLT